MRKARAAIEVEYENAADARRAHALLEKETGFKGRAGASVRIKNNALEIKVEADDGASFRATVNMFLRALSVMDAVDKAVEN